MGDFNFPKINWDRWSSKGDKQGESFIELLRDNYLYQHVTNSTRQRIGNEANILDLILSNEEEMVMR